MNQEQLDRAKRSEDHHLEQEAYCEIRVLLDDPDKPVTRHQIFRAIECYYDHSVGTTCWPSIQHDIRSLPDEDLRDTLLKLATEAINYDMRQYILKGKRTDRAERMCAALRA